MGGTSSLTSGILKIKISSALILLNPEVYVVQGEKALVEIHKTLATMSLIFLSMKELCIIVG